MKQKGFSLIEVLVACFLTLFLIMGTAELTLYSLLAKKRADCRRQMTDLMAAKIEYFKSLLFDSEELNPGEYRETVRPAGSQEVYEREWRIEDSSPRMKRIEVQVYMGRPSPLQSRMSFYRLKELGFEP